MRILNLPLLAAVVALAMQLPDLASTQSNDCHTAPLLNISAAATFYTTPSVTYPCVDDDRQSCMVWRIRSATSLHFIVTSCGFLADSSFAIRTDCNNGRFGDSTPLVFNDNLGATCAHSYTASEAEADIIADTDYYLSLGGVSLPATGGFGRPYNCEAGSTDHDGSDLVTHYSTPCVPCSPGQYVPAASIGGCSGFVCSIGTVDHDSDPSTPCLVAGPGNDTTTAGLFGPMANFKVVAGSYDHDSNPSTASIACPAGNYAPAGSTTCTPCAAGTWDHDGTSATACTNCTECALGSTYASGACTATTDRVCSPCITCTHGHYPNAECTLTSTATTCVPCTSITNCTITGLTCSSSSNHQCSQCQSGSYVTAQGTCELCSACGSGTYETRACDGIANRLCTTPADASPVAAIAVAVGSVLGVGLIALAIFLVRQRRRRLQQCSVARSRDFTGPIQHETIVMSISPLAKSNLHSTKESNAQHELVQSTQNTEDASYDLLQQVPEHESTESESHYAAPVTRPERQNAEGALRYEMPEKSPNHEDLQGPAQYAVPETNPDRPSSANTSRYEMPERTSPEGVSRYEMPERQGTEGASRYEMPEKTPTGGQHKEAHVHYEEMQNAHVRENKADIPSYEVPEKPTSEPLYHAVSSTSPDDIYDNEIVYMTGSNSHRIREGLAIVKHLASGNFGDVSLGEVPFAVLPPRAQGLLGSTSSEKVQVAVKSLKSNADEKSRKDFESEARLMAPFVHPNVVHLLAALVESEPHLVLIEFVRYGDLRSLLETSKNKSLWWTQNEQVHAVRQIALGMEYLGTLHFVHRDLAARNCLVGQNMVVKIADFGLSRELADESDYYRMQTRGKVPAKWMAPEALARRKFSSMSDVWSFGVTAWECCSYGDKPYGTIDARDIWAHVEAGGRLPMPESCSLDFYNLMLSCWHMSPEQRPSFSQLVATLTALQDDTTIRDIGAMV
ncbi:TKL protein kinase [Capsaspora owczarzaki ATCC 30864]|uniref:TKL protein kinase n=2 Tax=Capsaspora owczarzaki (strain ATCC 30864) TaxID=595528 RepID=A0A0D2VWV2_CAPO3|nr:TKL protein kinase [Capsaspora owczarzaki ATCC 30864]